MTEETLCINGWELRVKWDSTPAEPPTYCDGAISDPGCPAAAWVAEVKVGAEWLLISDVFSSDFSDRLDAALKEKLGGLHD